MAQAEHKEILNCDRDALYRAITEYENYPAFVEGAKTVQVDRAHGKVVASYFVSMMKDVRYKLEHFEDAASGVVSWKLIDSDTFKKNDGRWEIKSVGPGKTEARYSLDIEFKIPVPGFVLNRLVKGSLPPMVRSFAKRAQQLGGK